MRLNILLFVLGVWALQTQPVLPGMAWAWGIALAVPALWLRVRMPRAGRILLAAGFCAAGFFWAAWCAQARLADALPPGWEGRDMQIVGVVASLPQEHERGVRFDFDVERTLTPQAAVPRRIGLNWYRDERGTATLPEIHAGERWRFAVRLKRPHGNANPHGGDYEAWLLERGVRATGYIRADEASLRLAAQANRPGYWIERWRERIRDRIRQALPEAPYAGVLTALAVGDQQAIAPAQWQVFSRTGVNHLMSISGLHVTMLAGLAAALAYHLWRWGGRLSLLLPARKAAALSGFAAALAYAWLSGYAVPAQRTVYMLGVVAAALWLGKAGAPSVVLSLALFAVTLLDPWAVLAPGFWLSFGAVALILYVSAARLEEPHWLRTWLGVQWAVTLGLIPLLLALFQQISLVSPLANALAIPLVSLVVVPLALAGAVLPLDFLLWAAHQVMAGVMAVLEMLSAGPSAVWQQHAPPPWAMMVALAGIAWVLLPRGFPARWAGLTGLLPLFFVPLPAPSPGEAWLTVLDIGQGLAVVVQTHDHALLYDAGPDFSGEADSGNRIIVPFLRAAGIKRLDGMIVSHNDRDHSGGALSVLQALPVSWFASSLPDDHPLQRQAPHPRPCYAGQHWQWDGVRFAMLHPEWRSHADANLKDNARGCVLKISAGKHAVLLTADIESASERELLARAPQELPAQVLIVPHHGSRTSSTPEFIRRVHPETAIFTVGYRNRFGHPKAEVVQRYLDSGIRVYRSDRDGAITLHLGGAALILETYRASERRYWQEDWRDASREQP